MHTTQFDSKKFLTQVTAVLMIVMLMLTAMPVMPAYAANTGFSSPTICASGFGQWSNPANAQTSNDQRATSNNDGEDMTCTFNLPAIPPGNVITGIEVSVEGYASSSRDLTVDLSWNAGGTYTGGDPLVDVGGAEQIFTVGGSTNTWGRSWAVGDFTAANFRVRLSSDNDSGDLFVDHVRVNVHYSAPTTTTLTSSLNPSNPGDSVTFTATVTSGTPGTITGTVTFLDNGIAMGAGVALSGGTAQFTTSALTGGSHNITAVFSGDANYSGSTSPVLAQGVNQAPTIISANSTTFTVLNTGQTFSVLTTGFPASTITTSDPLPTGVTLSPAGVLSGTPATETAGIYVLNLTASNGVAPDATQVFTLTIAKRNQTINFNAQATAQYGTTFNVTPTATSGLPVTITSSGGCTNVGFAVTMTSGTVNCVLTASQAGDADYNAAANVVDTVTAQRANTTVSVSPDPSQSFYSQPFTFNVTVTSAGGIPEDSTITFLSSSPNQSLTFPLVGGVAQITISNLNVATVFGAPVAHGTFLSGTNPLRFTYNPAPGSNFNTDFEETSHTVYPAPTEVDITSDINPSAEGQSVTFTVTVSTTPPGTGTPPGTVILYDGATPISGTLTLTGGVVTFSTSTLTFGSHNISAQYTSTATNYATSNNTATPYVQVVSRATTTTLTSDINPSIYGQSVTFTSTTTSASAGAITGSVSFYDGATLLGIDNTIVAGEATFSTNALVVGTHPITAVYSGDATFATSTSVQLDQVVDKATLTVTADNQTITYGDADPIFTFQYSGFVLGQTSAVVDTPPTCAAPTPHVDAGTYPGIIVCSGGLDNNYTFNYVNGNLTVDPKALTITADDQAKAFNTTFTFSGTEFTASGLILGDTVASVTLNSPGAALLAPVGTYPITANAAVAGPGTNLGNYTINYVNGTMTVTTNTILTITAVDQTKIYGDVYTFNGNLAGGMFTVTGLIAPDTVTSITLISTGAPSPAVVGTYAIEPSAAVGTGLGNYTIVYVNGTMNVTPRDLTFNPNSQTKTYGDVFSAYTGAFNPGGLRVGDNITPIYDSLGAVATAPVGVYPITVTLDDPGNRLGNYNVTIDPAPAATLTVNPRALTITADNQTKVYGDLFAFTGTEFTTGVGQLVNGDTVDSVTLTSTGTPITALASPPTHPIVPTAATGTGLSNYAITYVNGAMTVTKPDLIVTSDGQTKTYGDVFPNASFTGSIVGLKAGDVITATYSSAGEPANANVGSYPIPIALNDPGGRLANYNLIQNVGDLTVVRRDLTVVVDNLSKVYGDPIALTGTVTGVQAGDNITFTYSSPGTALTAPVGTYSIAITMSDPGNRIGNYNYTATPGTLTVTLRNLIVTPDDQFKQYGTWFIAFTGSITGIQNGDNISANYASAGSPPSAVVGPHPITTTLNDPSGKLGNYNVTIDPATLTVGSSTLTVTADNKSIIYGDADPAFTFTYFGFAAGDTPAVLTTEPTCTVAGPHTDVGSYPIVCSGGVDDAYTFTYIAGTLNVTPRTLLVIPGDKTKVYGDVFSAFTGTITGLQFTDVITATYASTGAPATAAIGDYPITTTLVDPGNRLSNYTVNVSVGTLTVSPRALTVTPADKTKIYGDVFTLFTGTITGIQNGEAITATYSSPGAVATATVAGSPYPITAVLNAPAGVLANYSIILNTGDLTVTLRTLVVTPDNKAKVFGTTFSAFTGVVTGLQAGDVITPVYASTGAPAAAPVGTYPITVTLTDPGGRLPNYAVTLNQGTLTVGLSVLTVTANNQTIVYGDPDPAFTFTYAGFVGTDTPAVLDTPPACQVAVPHNNVGTFPITCSGGIDDNYVFTYVPATLTVTSRALTVTPANQTKIYGDVFTAFTGTVIGIQASDGITVTYSSAGAPANATVGTYPITAALNDPNGRLGNYTVTLNTGTLTVTQRPLVVTPDDKNKVYGAVFAAFTGSVTGVQAGDVITANYASAGAAATAVAGTYPITATLNDPGNKLPNYAVTLNTGTLTVTLRDLVVTPADKTKVYGNVFTLFTGTITGIQNGDAITATYASTGAPANATVAGSPYPITATLNAPAGVLASYNVILNTGDLSVTLRALTVTPDNQVKVFGTTFAAFTGTITGIQAGDVITATYASTGAPAAAAVGTYPITATLNDPGGRLPNYTVTLNQGTLTVGLSVLTVTANNQSIVYGDPDPAFTFTYAGFVGADTPAVINTQPTCQVAGAHNNVGTYPITCAGGTDDNYVFAYVPGTLTVTSRALTVTPANNSKIYGDTFSAFTGNITGIQGGDNITATYTSAGAPAPAAVGAYPITATLNDPGGRLANYTVTLNTGTLTVTQRALMVTPTDASKIYGNVFTIFTGTITGIQNGDAITATYASPGAAATATVGTYPITATLNAPAGVLNNYNVTSNTGTLTVTQRDLTVIPADKTKAYGTTFTAFTGSLVGLQNSDPITVTYSSPGAPAGAAVGAYLITATLNDPSGRLANYNVNLNTGTLDVTQATPTIALTSDNNPAGVADPITFTATVTSTVGTPTGTVTFFDGANALSTVPLAGGTATLTTSTLPTGLHTITAVYNGDVNYLNGTSAPYIQGVGQTVTSTTVTSNNNPSIPGQSVTFTAIVSAATGVPTGTVAFLDGATTLGTGTLAGGVTTFTTSALISGSHNITASYGGDPDYFVSVSAVLVQVVIPDTSIVANPPNPDSDTTPVFAFTSPDPAATFQCRMDGGVFTACISGDAFGPITAGPHTFEVRAVNTSNTPDPTPASYTWTVDLTAPDTTINSNPPAVTNILDAAFTFSSAAVDLASFECQLDGGGFAACTTPLNYTGLTPGSHTFQVRAVDNVGNVDPSPATYTWVVDLAYPVVLFNGNTIPGQDSTSRLGPTKFQVAFSKDLKNDGSAGAANLKANYILVEDGVNGTFDTLSCSGGLVADDVVIPMTIPTFDNNGGSGPFIATATVNGGVRLPDGVYRLFVCGTTSIEDLAGNELNNGLSDSTITFTVDHTIDDGSGGQNGNTTTLNGLLMPATGFPQGQITKLSEQPANMAYAATDVWLEIPKLGVKMSIMGVLQTKTGWDVSWLGKNAGWLNGSTFPTWSGNSVLTGHVWDALNQPGPFAQLKSLKYGDQVKIHAFGEVYTYAISENTLVSPSDTASVFKHANKTVITLITCEDYMEKSQTYLSRRMVRAVLISVTKEK